MSKSDPVSDWLMVLVLVTEHNVMSRRLWRRQLESVATAVDKVDNNLLPRRHIIMLFTSLFYSDVA